MSQDESARLADALDHLYDDLVGIEERIETDDEREAVERLERALDFAHDLALQREAPTPNQKLLEAVGGPDAERPDDPRPWEDYEGKDGGA